MVERDDCPNPAEQRPGSMPQVDSDEHQGSGKQSGESEKSGRGKHGDRYISDKPAARPTPSGVPNEGRKAEGQIPGQDVTIRPGQSGYKYKGGRQGTGGPAEA
jgi:hypothetical protein